MLVAIQAPTVQYWFNVPAQARHIAGFGFLDAFRSVCQQLSFVAYLIKSQIGSERR